MAKKGIDSTFVHYGIRKDDMQLIEALCLEHQIEFDWIKDEILKEYHEKKIKSEEIDEKGIEKVIDKSLSKIK